MLDPLVDRAFSRAARTYQEGRPGYPPGAVQEIMDAFELGRRAR